MNFPLNLFIVILLWPVWWIVGIEQFVVPVFFVYSFVIMSIKNRNVMVVPRLSKITVVFIFVCLLPILWITNYGLFFKTILTFFSQAIIFIIFANCIKDKSDLRIIEKSLYLYSAYIGIGSIIFASGLWQGETRTLIGLLISKSSSSFINSISIRGFGTSGIEKIALGSRATSFSLAYSSLSMICLILLPFTYWYFIKYKKYLSGFMVSMMLLIGLIYTQSRLSILIFIFGMFLLFVLLIKFLHKNDRFLVYSSLFLFLILFSFLFILFHGEIYLLIYNLFTKVRSSSSLTRFKIYYETLSGIKQHFLVGWGHSNPIEGMDNIYSAGTHSSYLGMFYQHGLLGLLVYLFFWLNVWKEIFNSLNDKLNQFFYSTLFVSIVMFNIREAADVWWFDQNLCLPLWIIIGLMISRKNMQDHYGIAN